MIAITSLIKITSYLNIVTSNEQPDQLPAESAQNETTDAFRRTPKSNYEGLECEKQSAVPSGMALLFLQKGFTRRRRDRGV